MRICIYKSDRSPELTLMLPEGRSLPVDGRGEPWQKFKTVTEREVRADLLVQIGKAGYSVIRLDAVQRH